MAGPWDKLTKSIVDTHCHIHHYEKPLELAELLHKQKISVHCVTVRPSEFDQCRKMFGGFSNITPCLGLFPLNVTEENILEDFLKEIHKTRYIGEIGLDYSVESEEEKELQRETFQRIINECNKTGDKILSIHSRRSAEDVLEHVGKSFKGSAIMHWFSGNPDLVKDSPENVFYSINTAMLKSRQGKKIIRALRPDQVLTETDGPYVKINDTPAVPADIRTVINSLKEIWGISLEETVETISSNYLRAHQ